MWVATHALFQQKFCRAEWGITLQSGEKTEYPLLAKCVLKSPRLQTNYVSSLKKEQRPLLEHSRLVQFQWRNKIFVVFLQGFLRKVVEFYCVAVFSRVNVSLLLEHLISFIVMLSNCLYLALSLVRSRHVFESCTCDVVCGKAKFLQDFFCCGFSKSKTGSKHGEGWIQYIKCSGWAHGTALEPKRNTATSLLICV